MSKNITKAELIEQLRAAEKRTSELELALKQPSLSTSTGQEKEKATHLLEFLPVGVSILDTDQKVVYENPALQRILDLSAEDLHTGAYKKRKYLSADGSPMPSDGFASIQARKSGKPVYNVETGVVKENGETIWTSVSAVPVEFPDWKTIIVTTETTERNLAEKELKESEERFSTAFFTSPVAQSIIDPVKGEILAVNDRCCNLFEYSRRELIGANPERLKLWANPAERLAATEELQRTDHLPPREAKIRTKSGEIRTVIAAIEPIQWSGTPCLISSILDITERKQAEERVRISEGQLQALVTSLDDIVFEVDEDGTYLNVWTSNDAILFKPREQVIGKRFDEVFGKEVSRPFFEYLARTLDGDTAQTLEYPVDIAGSQYWFAARYNPIHSKEGRKTVSILVRDITERKQAEEERFKVEALLHSVLNNAPITIFALDEQGRFTLSDGKGLEKVGLKPGEDVGVYALDLYESLPFTEHNGNLTNGKNIVQRALSGEIVKAVNELRGVRFDNYIGPVYDTQGKIAGVVGVATDITERNQAEEKLQRSEALLREMGRIAKIGGWELDVATMQQEWTDGTFAIHDRERGIYDPNSAEELSRFEPGSRETIEKAFGEALAQGKPYDLEVEMTTVKGNRKWVRAVCIPVLVNGKVVKLTGTTQDITERKQAEEALRESEEQYRYLFENNPHPMWAYDLKTLKFLAVNDSAVEKYGYSRSEFLNMTIADIRPSEDVARLTENIAEPRPSLQHSGEWRHCLKDGTIIDVEISSHTLNLSGHDAALVVALDITERKKAQEALRESEAKYRTLITSTMDGVFVAQDEKFIFANPALPTSLGYDMEEFENIPFEKVLVPEYLELFTRRFHQRVAGESPVFNYQVQFMNKTWTNKVWFELRANLTTYQGRPAVLGIARDITERKQAEEVLRESEERYRQAITAADAIPYALDYTTNRYTFVGEGIEKLTGISASEFSPGMFAEMHLESIMQGDLKGMHVVEAIQLARQGKAGPLWKCDHCIRTRSGAIRWYSDSAIQILGEDGIPRSSIGIIQDITERKQTEEKLRQRLTELEVLYTSGLILNRLSNPQEIGKKVIELLEQKMHWHHSVIRLHNPEERSLSLLAFSQPTLADEQEYQKVKDLLEKNIMKSDEGLSGWAVQNNQAIRVNNISKDPRYRETYTGMHSGLYVPVSLGENVIGVISIESEKPDGFSESDERFVATLSNQAAIAIENARLNNDLERRVRERTAEVQDLYDNAPTGYHSLDSNGRFVRVNRTELNWLGYSQEELLGHPVAEFLTERSVARFRENFPIFKKNGSLRDLELEFIRKDGSTMPSLINAIAIYDTQGNYMMSHSTVFDNTERKKAEVALRESQENLQYFFDTASDLIQSMDENGNYQYVNNAWSRTLGYSSREALQMTMADVIDPSYQEHCQELLSSLIADQHPRQMEVVFRNKAGEPVIVDGSVSSRKDKSGHIVTNGIFRNITERKKAEDALRASEARLNFLLSKTPAMIFSANLTYPLPITFMSDSVREIVGYEPQQYYEDPDFWPGLIHPDDVDTGVLAMQGLIEKGHAVWESRILRPDGTYQWMSTGASLLLGETGQPREIIGFSVNIDDRKQAEEALRESEEQNRLLFEEAPESVVLLDDHGRILRMNRAFETLTGHPREILLGRRAEQTDLLPPQEMQSLLQSIEENVRSGAEFTSSNFKLIRADGTPRDVRVNVFPLRIQGRIHYLSTMHDVTAEKQAEETLRLANSELERALRLKDEFLANMSHELRTPLNAILGISESLMEQVAGPLNDKQLKYTQTVHESGQHLLALINDVLDLAKINAGKVELEMSRVEAAAIAQSCLRLVRELAQKKSLELSLDLDPAVSLFLADERRLKQMIVNLLSNAVKFTPSGGRVGLQIRGDAHNRILHFSVWDTGIGIPPDEIQYLFQPFVQLDAGLARDAQGTGLGLVLVSQMARLHGGSVRVESQPGQGSRFTISIPWRAAAQTGSLRRAAQPNRNSAPAPEGNQRPTILLVEDTEAVSMLIHDYLESHGYQVFVARNGFEGITQAQQLRPKLILMDVMMPEMDGLETTRRLRSLPGFEHTPIIALTALAMPGDRDRCLAAGMNDYLSKPVKLSEVMSIIEQYITRDDKGKT